jgi:predicted RNA binding protein YcfA (HicA-like mRNA interferase family)
VVRQAHPPPYKIWEHKKYEGNVIMKSHTNQSLAPRDIGMEDKSINQKIDTLEKYYPEFFDFQDDSSLDGFIVLPAEENFSEEAFSDLDSNNNLSEDMVEMESLSRIPNIDYTHNGITFGGSKRDYYITDQIQKPTDCFGMYLPFHYYTRNRWGIYLFPHLIEGYSYKMMEETGLSKEEAQSVIEKYVAYHEMYHHKVESLSARWEILFQNKMYIEGFSKLYSKTVNTKNCLEEALAEAYAYEKVKQILQNPRTPSSIKSKKKEILKYFRNWIENSPTGYCEGINYLNKKENEQATYRFLEELYDSSIGKSHPSTDLWELYPKGLDGLSSIKNIIAYLWPKGKPLPKSLNARLLSSNKLLKFLRQEFGEFQVREGKGSHRLYYFPQIDKKTVISFHPGDMNLNTLKSIFNQLGRKVSHSQIKKFL